MNDTFNSRLHRHVLSAQEIAGIPWLDVLTPALRERALLSLRAARLAPRDSVCRMGEPANYWLGVSTGLLKVGNTDTHGTTVTFSGLPAGAWFCEGTLLKREAYRYEVQALRESVVMGLPTPVFFELLDQSIGFSRFVMNQLNERLSQFIGSMENDRLNDPDARVAQCLSQLFNGALFPGLGMSLSITQQELAYLAGLSRQRVNQALKTLCETGVIVLEYGGLRVLDMAALRGYGRRADGEGAA
jgi:CRP-like cAMP-binding protein